MSHWPLALQRSLHQWPDLFFSSFKVFKLDFAAASSDTCTSSDVRHPSLSTSLSLSTPHFIPTSSVRHTSVTLVFFFDELHHQHSTSMCVTTPSPIHLSCLDLRPSPPLTRYFRPRSRSTSIQSRTLVPHADSRLSLSRYRFHSQYHHPTTQKSSPPTLFLSFDLSSIIPFFLLFRYIPFAAN